MKINRILNAEPLTCVEPAFAELTEDLYTDLLLERSGEEARLLIDEEEIPLALAFRQGEIWVMGSFLFRHPTLKVIQRFEEVGGDLYQEDRSKVVAALREYYSLAILERVTPTVEDVPPDRHSLVREILLEVWGEKDRSVCLDCCCGSGIGASALRSLGMTPLAYDHDPALLALGLRQGRLIPEDTMCIDATVARRYCPSVERGAAFMLGEIDPFNREMWRQIVEELLALTRDTLITVRTEPEVHQVADWARAYGHQVDVTEHKADPIYEHWICRITQDS
jgi:hypothetical protein